MPLVKLTEPGLRAAMRDPRYWGSYHPEQKSYRDWATRGWRALAQAETRGGGTVHVRAYTRVRNGHSEQVSAYTQMRSGAGHGVLMPIADKRPPNLPPQPPGGTRRGPGPDSIPSRTVPLGASPLTPILPDVGIKPVQSLPLGGVTIVASVGWWSANVCGAPARSATDASRNPRAWGTADRDAEAWNISRRSRLARRR